MCSYGWGERSIVEGWSWTDVHCQSPARQHRSVGLLKLWCLGYNKYVIQNVIFRPSKITNCVQNFVLNSNFCPNFCPGIERYLISKRTNMYWFPICKKKCSISLYYGRLVSLKSQNAFNVCTNFVLCNQHVLGRNNISSIMSFLIHLYASFVQILSKIANFISFFVQNAKFRDYQFVVLLVMFP